VLLITQMEQNDGKLGKYPSQFRAI